MSVASFLLPAQPPPAGRVSFEAYYEVESKAATRSEFIDGIVRPMAGASEEHGAVTSILGELINPRLRRAGGCRLRDQDTQIPIPAYNVYTYPDAVIACPPRFAKRPKGALLNPKTIFEVLSPSTESYDRNDKFLYYRSLESFEEYVLISVDRPLVETFDRRTSWEKRTYEGLDAVAQFESVGLDLPLRELYADVGFES